ncbi:hypothetical protein [Sphingomonas beigongshangi]|uniref:hypothetical protein n=1 Tax=Sphingomonas beigongshangi TaxID=2782540 RepID=UPI001AEE2156|nr:hypothetical protein [Sphingomonas beigongshangi]
MTLLRLSAAPIDGASIIPNALVDQHVKPTAAQAALVDALRLTAIAWVENHTRHALQRRIWTATFDNFCGDLDLPRHPVRAVTGLRYAVEGGAWIDGAALGRLAGNTLVPVATWPTVTGRAIVEVTFEAGFDDLATEAAPLQIATLMLILHLFVGGSLKDVPDTIGMLIDETYRMPVMA